MSTYQQFGRFIDEERCFELTGNPPRKWFNLHYNKIGDNEMYAEISEIGDGPIFVRDSRGNKCNLVSYDSKFSYIRDEDSGTVFCPWGIPAPQEVTDRSCRYYTAKTVVTGTCEELKVTQRVFVPADYATQVTTFTVENMSDRTRKVSVFVYARFDLGGNNSENGGVGAVKLAEIKPEIGGVFCRNISADVPTDRFNGYYVTINDDDYAGANGYRDHFTRSDYGYGTPNILWGWNCDNQDGYGYDCAGVVQVTFEIEAGTSKRADFLLGTASSVDEVKSIRAAMTPESIDRMCDEQMAVENERAEKFTVKTGNAHFDSLLNTFVKKQMYSYLINKSGFRDNLQMDNALCMVDYQATEDNILRALASQYPTGSVPHGFRPIVRLQYADKPAWTMLAVPGLIAESGDLSLLDKEAPYFESSEKGTVWDHMLRAARFLAGDLGPNGLCNLHHADWNDGLESSEGTGERETVMVTQQLCYGLKQLMFLAEKIGDTAVLEECTQMFDAFNKRLNDVAWDGGWYIRAICGDGYRIGSQEDGNRCFVNTQSWAILSGTAPEDRAQLAFRKVDENNESDLGFRVVWPPYDGFDPRVGVMTDAAPGQDENGGAYCHAGGFKAVADCMLGRAEEAWRTFAKTVPDWHENPITNSKKSPFSFTNSYSSVKQQYGLAGFPWQTGTASWYTICMIEWILGARRSFDGLLIDPCLKKDVREASITRMFRGARYHVSLDNSAGRCKGATRITCDGQTIDGNVLPDFREGEHTVEVVI